MQCDVCGVEIQDDEFRIEADGLSPVCGGCLKEYLLAPIPDDPELVGGVSV